MSDTDEKEIKQPDAANKLGTEPVGKLLLNFAIPAITGMVVNALYNVVDRIFVGRGVGETALGGLALVMPLMSIVMAFAMLIGFGAANMISMRLGQGRKEEAENAIDHCFWMLTLAGVLLMVFGTIFLDPLLSLMGAQEGSEAIVYARSYMQIILFGSVFWLLSFGFSHCTRAQGFPKVTMVSMFIGAGVNTALDPLFIFVFGWGVEGAALATIIAQFASTVFIVSFCLSKKAVVRLTPFGIRPSLSIIRQITMFGSAQFFMNIAASVVQVIFNGSAAKYGVAAFGTAAGGDVALSGMNIIGSVSMLVYMPVFGINQGTQPVLGYNYGAKKYDRVISAYIKAVIAATAVCTVGFLFVELFPDAIVRLFAPDGSAELLSFTPKAMRIVLMVMPLVGFQFVSSIMFTATGRPNIAMVLSLLRQIIILIPCILIFGYFWQLDGVVAATPAADFAACALTAVLIAGELKKLKENSLKQKREEQNT